MEYRFFISFYQKKQRKKIMAKKIFLFTFILMTTLLSLKTPLYAIYEIGIGISAGVTYDANNLENEIGRYNTAMESYQASNPGTEITQLNIPYEVVLGINTRFRLDFFLIKIGCYYTQAFLYPTLGSIETPAGTFNDIRFEAWQISLPLSIGFMLEASRRCIFYLGGGFTTFFVNLEIKQSSPDTVLGLPSDRKRDVFNTYFFGYHLFIGVELPLVIKRLSISVEWVYQQGISDPVKSSESSEKRTINATGNGIILGINYYFTL